MRLGRIRYESKYLAIEYYHVKEGWSIRWLYRQLMVCCCKEVSNEKHWKSSTTATSDHTSSGSLRAAADHGILPMFYLELTSGPRRTFATMALQSGIDPKTVSGMLGHYSAEFTLDIYTNVTKEMQKEAAKRIGGFMADVL